MLCFGFFSRCPTAIDFPFSVAHFKYSYTTITPTQMRCNKYENPLRWLALSCFLFFCFFNYMHPEHGDNIQMTPT